MAFCEALRDEASSVALIAGLVRRSGLKRIDSSVRSERELLDEVLGLCRSIASVAFAEKGNPHTVQAQFEHFLTIFNMFLDELNLNQQPLHATTYALFTQLDFAVRSLVDVALPSAEFRFYIDSLLGQLSVKYAPQFFQQPSV